jgi:hypothetical protein
MSMTASAATAAAGTHRARAMTRRDGRPGRQHTTATAPPAPMVITPPTSAPSRPAPTATPSASMAPPMIAARRRERGIAPHAAATPTTTSTGRIASSSLPIPKKRDPNRGLGPRSERITRWSCAAADRGGRRTTTSSCPAPRVSISSSSARSPWGPGGRSATTIACARSRVRTRPASVDGGPSDTPATRPALVGGDHRLEVRGHALRPHVRRAAGQRAGERGTIVVGALAARATIASHLVIRSPRSAYRGGRGGS